LISHLATGNSLLERTGLFIPPERANHLAYCLRAARRDMGFADLDSYLSVLQDSLPTHPAWQRLLHHLAIGETYFFRDAAVLKERILPGLIARRRGDGSYTLRIWSAGCASGEEPYTIAILLHNLLPDIARWTITIVGTDINLEALSFARRGLYTAWSVRSAIPASADAFLRPRGNRWQVADDIRHMVEFRYLNLIDSHVALTNADLIVCRNVLLYLDRRHHAPIATRLKAALADGGELLLDTPASSSAALPARQAQAADSAPIHPPHPAPSGPTPPVMPPGEPIWQAKRAADRAQWAEAHHWLDRAEAANRLDLPAHYLRALVYESQGRIADAIDALRRCLYLDHNFALGYFTLGNLHAQRGEREQAELHWLNAAQLLETQSPDDPLLLADGMTVSDVLATIRHQLEDSRS
jgi:chemotaxis protein methyltransferase CheR